MTLKAFEDFLLKMVAKKTYRKVLYPLPTLQQRIECTVCQKLKNVRIHYSGMYYFAHIFGCILHKFSIYSTLQICTIPIYLSVYFKQLPALLCQVLHFAKYISSKLPKGLKLQNSKLKSCSTNYLVLLFRPWICKLSRKWVHE